MSTTRRILTRTIKVGEPLTLDGGRIVVHPLERTGRNAWRVRLEMDDDVVVNKHEHAIPDARANVDAT